MKRMKLKFEDLCTKDNNNDKEIKIKSDKNNIDKIIKHSTYSKNKKEIVFSLPWMNSNSLYALREYSKHNNTNNEQKERQHCQHESLTLQLNKKEEKEKEKEKEKEEEENIQPHVNNNANVKQPYEWYNDIQLKYYFEDKKKSKFPSSNKVRAVINNNTSNNNEILYSSLECLSPLYKSQKSPATLNISDKNLDNTYRSNSNSNNNTIEIFDNGQKVVCQNQPCTSNGSLLNINSYISNINDIEDDIIDTDSEYRNVNSNNGICKKIHRFNTVNNIRSNALPNFGTKNSTYSCLLSSSKLNNLKKKRLSKSKSKKPKNP